MNWFIAHLVGDFILQNDWMAQNKKLRTWPCLVHVTLYTLAMWGFTRWPWWAIAIVAVTHFIQDRTPIIGWWMKFNRQKSFMQCDKLDPLTFEIKPGLGPWSIIVVDNVWHLVTLFAISAAVSKWT